MSGPREKSVDLVVLQRLAAELSAQIAGARVDQVYAIPKQHLSVVLGKRGASRLWFCSEPDLPHLYERPGSPLAPATAGLRDGRPKAAFGEAHRFPGVRRP